MPTLPRRYPNPWRVLPVLAALLAPALSLAAEPVAPNKGDTAWMLTSTALVLLMSVPALALFYGGLVRTKNMLSVLMQVFVGFSLITVLWCIYGYSLAFTQGNAFIGGFVARVPRRHLRPGDAAPSPPCRPSPRARCCTSWSTSPSRPPSPPSPAA